MRDTKVYYDKEWLYEMLIIRNMSYKEVGEIFGMTYGSINKIAAEFVIKKKDAGMAGAKNQENTKFLKDKKWLMEQYLVLNKSLSDIADELKVGKTTVAKACVKFGLEKSEEQRRTLLVEKLLQRDSISISSIEYELMGLLDKLELTYIHQYQIDYWVPDFYLPEYNLVLECYGDYWHWNKEVMEKRTKKEIPEQVKANLKNDKRKKHYLTERGYNFMYVWENDINGNLDRCAQKILNMIEKIETNSFEVI